MKTQIAVASILVMFIAMTATLTGCISAQEQARRVEEKQQARQAMQQQFLDGWSKLQKGMSVQEVLGLIGVVFHSNPTQVISQYGKRVYKTNICEVTFGGMTGQDGLESWKLYH